MNISNCICNGRFGTSFSGGESTGWVVYCTDCGREPLRLRATKKEAADDWNVDINSLKSIKYCAYIGRWQSPHRGHRYLIDQSLAKGKPVLILIRDVPTDENNPFTAQEVDTMLRVAFKKETRNGLVAIQIIPDIMSINYGRGVGYDVVCHEEAIPPEIKAISATEIRRQIRAGENGWRPMVMDGVEDYLEEKFK